MLYMAAGGQITRVHGPFATDEEVEKLAGGLKKLGVTKGDRVLWKGQLLAGLL